MYTREVLDTTVLEKSWRQRLNEVNISVRKERSKY